MGVHEFIVACSLGGNWLKSKGNSDPQVCANNLLKIARYEVPMDRIQGLDTELYDTPDSEDDIVEDAKFVIETYEPRVEVSSIDIENVDGDIKVTANVCVISEGEEEDDE